MNPARVFGVGILASGLLGACSFRGAAAPGESQQAAAAAPHDTRAEIFVQRGCTECHVISALRVKAARDVAPDLTFAYGDVVNRYGVTLEAFLHDPSGVMRMMLASHLRLSAVDRDSMVHILRTLYEEHREQVDSGPPP